MTAHRRPEIRFSDAPRGTCRWCGEAIVHPDGPKAGEPNLRRRWHPECVAAYEESDPREARRRVRKRDRGVCAACGLDTKALRRSVRGRGMTKKLREKGFVPRRSLWELDHVVPLVDGGGHELSNLQTLCTPCHRAKTADEARARARRNVAEAAPPAANEAASEPTAAAEEAPAETPAPSRRRALPRAKPVETEASLDDLLDRASVLNDRVESTLRSLRSRG